MNTFKTIAETLLLDKNALKTIMNSTSYNKWSKIIMLLIGIAYGTIAFYKIPSEFVSFDSNLLNSISLLVMIIVGFLMVLVTKIGLTFLLWAGGKAFGGPGIVRVLNSLTSFALIPTIIGLPAILSLSNGEPLSSIMYITLAISLIWVYLISVKIVEVSQKLSSWKAYVAVLIVFIFFSSVYYLTLPPPTS